MSFCLYDTETTEFNEIFTPEELRDKVYNSIKYYKERGDEYLEEIHKLRENALQKVSDELLDEIQSYQEDARMSWGRFDSEKELKAYNDFVERHMHNRMASKANGGKAPYIIPNYTGIGCIKKVVCQICGESEDITDTGVW